MKSFMIGTATAFALVASIAAQAATTLPDPVRAALSDAIDDEYRAEAFYAVVIDKFGAVRPFSNIINAERMHSSIIADLMKQYGMTVPSNPYLDGTQPKPAAPASIGLACQTGVDAEIANRDLYDKRLIPAAKDYPDIIAALKQLRDASENNHLPAFQRCVARAG